MAKVRSPNRFYAYDIYKKSKGAKPLVEIAEMLNINSSQIRKWKSMDKWEQMISGEIPEIVGDPYNPSNKEHPEMARFANSSAVGHGAPKRNKNAERFGFFSKILPEEALDLATDILNKNPIDILWESIVIQYAAIARAQKIMFVKNQEDMTRELKKIKSQKETIGSGDNKRIEETYREEEYEIQFAWDKQASFLQAQSKAMSTLQGMIRKYEERLHAGLSTREQKLRIEKLKIDIDKIKNDDGNDNLEDDGFIQAMESKVSEVWDDVEEY